LRQYSVRRRDIGDQRDGAGGGDAAILSLSVALSLGACLGGNGMLIGASADLTVAGITQREGLCSASANIRSTRSR
jgi:Na+/H+ antiporter NhaD/arsenite permease-like protein